MHVQVTVGPSLGLIFGNLGDGESRARNFLSLPARTSQVDFGTKYRSDGVAITAYDRKSNAIADREAKIAAFEFSVSNEALCDRRNYKVAAIDSL